MKRQKHSIWIRTFDWLGFCEKGWRMNLVYSQGCIYNSRVNDGQHWLDIPFEVDKWDLVEIDLIPVRPRVICVYRSGRTVWRAEAIPRWWVKVLDESDYVA